MPDQKNNYYQILDVSEDASVEEIKKSFRFLCHAFHPDKHASESHKLEAEEKTKRINEAYTILKDATRRSEYDATRLANVPDKKSSRQESSSPQPDGKVHPENQRSKPTGGGNSARKQAPLKPEYDSHASPSPRNGKQAPPTPQHYRQAPPTPPTPQHPPRTKSWEAYFNDPKQDSQQRNKHEQASRHAPPNSAKIDTISINSEFSKFSWDFYKYGFNRLTFYVVLLLLSLISAFWLVADYNGDGALSAFLFGITMLSGAICLRLFNAGFQGGWSGVTMFSFMGAIGILWNHDSCSFILIIIAFLTAGATFIYSIKAVEQRRPN